MSPLGLTFHVQHCGIGRLLYGNCHPTRNLGSMREEAAHGKQDPGTWRSEVDRDLHGARSAAQCSGLRQRSWQSTSLYRLRCFHGS